MRYGVLMLPSSLNYLVGGSNPANENRPHFMSNRLPLQRAPVVRDLVIVTDGKYPNYNQKDKIFRYRIQYLKVPMTMVVLFPFHKTISHSQDSSFKIFSFQRRISII